MINLLLLAYYWFLFIPLFFHSIFTRTDKQVYDQAILRQQDVSSDGTFVRLQGPTRLGHEKSKIIF